MSSDVMVICKEDNSNFHGDHTKALFIDEASMGEAWTEFGRWFQSRFCGAPTFFEQLSGFKQHIFTKFESFDYQSCVEASSRLEINEDFNVEDLQPFIGKHISTENW